MILEIYSFENKLRIVDRYEYKTQVDVDKKLMLCKLAGSLVGYKIYYLSMAKFMSLTTAERNNLPYVGEFDKAAYINKRSN